MKILLIEDEEDLTYAISLGLKKSGYVVEVAADGQEGLDLFFINRYDLIILDLNLPTLDGLDVLAEIRKNDKDIRIIILSARSDYTQRILGLDMGANDYLCKPFNFGELEARVRSLLRRNFIQEDVILKIGDLSLNTVTRTVFVGENEVKDLTPKEFSILQYLLLNRNRTVSAEELLEHIWYSENDLFSNAIKVHISTLRKKIATYYQGELIVTIRGVGYTIKETETSYV